MEAILESQENSYSLNIGQVSKDYFYILRYNTVLFTMTSYGNKTANVQ